MPYVPSRLNWLARSSLSFGTRLGIDAAVAGFQNSEAIPARNFAAYSQVRFGNSGMDRNSSPRRTSPMIIVRRRSSRSAIAPASGPSSSAGSSVATQTPPIAVVWAAAAAVTDCPWLCFWVRSAASASSAKMLSQSPRLDRDRAIHSRRNGLTDRTLVPRA